CAVARGGSRPGSESLLDFRQSHAAVVASGLVGGDRIGLYPIARRVHNARFAGRRQVDDDRQPDSESIRTAEPAVWFSAVADPDGWGVGSSFSGLKVRAQGARACVRAFSLQFMFR